MLSRLAGSGIVIAPTPTAHFGAGAVGKLPGIVRGLGGAAVVVVTDVVLAATPVVARVAGVLEAAGLPVTVFSGVHPNPTTGDLAAGAETAAAARAGASRPDEAGVALVAVGGGSPIDAAKGIALAAVNPQRGRDLDYRGEFACPALGTGEPGRGARWNADAAIAAIADLAGRLSLTQRLADLEITGADFEQIAADALDDEVLANTPRRPAAADIHAILQAARQLSHRVPACRPPVSYRAACRHVGRPGGSGCRPPLLPRAAAPGA